MHFKMTFREGQIVVSIKLNVFFPPPEVIFFDFLSVRWKRAESRYTVERATIISHWNWLQAHISDLEYRIRQQTDIYRQIRASKVSVFRGHTRPFLHLFDLRCDFGLCRAPWSWEVWPQARCLQVGARSRRSLSTLR